MSARTEFNYHIELASELARVSETGQVIEERTEIEQEYEVGPHGQLSLYRLYYITDGGAQKTDTVSTTPGKDVFVDLNFTCIKRILGLDEILDVLADTRPAVENIGEWELIRNSIIEYKDQSVEVQFRQLVGILGQITPARANLFEWANIRKTCSEILASWDNVDKQLLLRKLLARFLDTIPGVDNKAEWARIRAVSKQIQDGLKQLF